MKLVEDHEPNAFQLRILDYHPGEHALGEDLDPRAGTDPGLMAHAVPDGIADLLAQRIRHPPGRCPGRQTPGLEHQDSPAGEPRLVQELERNTGGLAGSGGRLKYCGRAGSLACPSGAE